MSLFIDDACTGSAQALLGGIRRPLMISPLARLEYRTAIWKRVARGTFTVMEGRLVVSEFERQAAKGRFLVPGYEEESVWLEAERLTDSNTTAHHLRSLDILHVAFAVAAGAKRFWSFDDRQKRLAEAVGLEVNR